MMIFRIHISEDTDPGTELLQFDISLSDSDFGEIARRIKKCAVNSSSDSGKHPFLSKFISLLIPIFAHENVIAFVCGILQTGIAKKKLKSTLNSALENQGMFFRLSDYVIEHR